MDHNAMCCAVPEPQADGLDAEGIGGPAADAAPAATAPAAPMNGIQDASAASIDTAGPAPDEREHPAEHAVSRSTDAVDSGEPVSALQSASTGHQLIAEAEEPVRVVELTDQQDVDMSEARGTSDAPGELLEEQAATETPMEA